MEFLTLHELSRELNVPERIIRYRFKQLLSENKITEGDDYIRDDFKDESHFVYKINPVRFAQLTNLKPAPLPSTSGYQTDTNIDNNGYQPVTRVDTKNPELGINSGNQPDNLTTSRVLNNTQPDMTRDIIELLKAELRERNEQLRVKDGQLKAKDEQIERAQLQAKDSQNTQFLAIGEIIRLNKRLQLNSGKPTATNVDTNGYQSTDDVATNFGNQEPEIDTNAPESDNNFDTNDHEDSLKGETPQQ